MNILGIETSCDETSASIVVDGRTVLSNIIASSAAEQSAFGGVVPELAARRQLECIVPVIQQSLSEAGFSWNQVDAMAVTRGPGLLTSLLVGTTVACILSSVVKIPLVGVHHTMGHLSSPWLDCSEDIFFPILSLSVSGGHSEILLRESHTKQQLLGRTRDDAAGEAFDKGAMLFGLPYPGGPALSRMAVGGNPHYATFPQPLHAEKTCDFSFSGLKTALKYAMRDRGGFAALSVDERRDLAAGYEFAICSHLLSGLQHAMHMHSGIRELHIVGGVSANSRLREMLLDFVRTQSIALRMPLKLAYCTDNAAMIASAGYFLLRDQPLKASEPFATQASVNLQC